MSNCVLHLQVIGSVLSRRPVPFSTVVLYDFYVCYPPSLLICKVEFIAPECKVEFIAGLTRVQHTCPTELLRAYCPNVSDPPSREAPEEAFDILVEAGLNEALAHLLRR